MVRLFALLGLVFTLLCSSEAKAGFFICNDTGTTLNVAVGWVDAQGVENAHGWWIIEPQKCQLPIQGPLAGGFYYFYAKGGDLTYTSPNGGFFCANHNNKFDYAYNGNPTCDGYGFVEVNVGDNQVWTHRLTENRTDPTTAASNCSQFLSDQSQFVKCWTRQIASSRQKQILDCMDTTNSPASLSICAGKGFLGDREKKAADCALRYNNNTQPIGLVECLDPGLLDDHSKAALNCAIEKGQQGILATAGCMGATQLSPEQRRIYDCVAAHADDYKAAGVCIGLGRLNQDQQRIANCVMNSNGSYVQMGVCAVGNKLTPEQQVFASCAISSGGQPYVFAGCVGTQLTVNELQKCFTQGIGGSGCFGRNNTVVLAVSNAWKDVTKGPGPSNDLLGRDGFLGRTLENARHDIENGPGPTNDVFGGQGWVGQRLEDIRKSAPPPAQLGTVRGARVCIPWC